MTSFLETASRAIGLSSKPNWGVHAIIDFEPLGSCSLVLHLLVLSKVVLVLRS
jgi:hypothetical protein